MVVNVGGPNGQNPQGDGLDTDTASFYQFGFFVSTTEQGTINDYFSNLVDTLTNAYETAAQARDDFEQAVTDAEDAAAEEDPPGEPQYPDPPDPTEVSATDPYSAFGLSEFLNQAAYDTNYEYQIQIPD